MLRLCFLPKGEVGRIMFLALSIEVTGGIQYIVQVASGEFTVMIIFIVFGYIKVDGTFAFVSIAGFQDFANQFNLLYNMSRCVWLDTWRKDVQCIHRFVITVQVVLYHFHRL